MSIALRNYKTWVEVSKKALLNNVEIVRRLLKPGVKLMAVVKSNAYGHGLLETAKILGSGTTAQRHAPLSRSIWLGVDNIDEAILLRISGIKSPVLVMGFTPKERFGEAARHDLRLTLYNKISPGDYAKIKFHLKIDSGMSRQGVTLADLPRFIKTLPRGTNIEGVFTHFANADNLQDRSYPDLQFNNFKKALQILEESGINPTIRHVSATTGLLTMPEAQFDMVRIGLALYGLWPSAEFVKKFNPPTGGLGLEPTLSWKTRIAQIKKIKKNTPVGYGITERVKKDSTIAVLPVGYYDGYDRGLSSIEEVLISGRRCKVLGRISMNLMVVDVSDVNNPKVWDEVILIGTQGTEQITAEELAGKIGTIGYEVVSRINPLLPRVYLE